MPRHQSFENDLQRFLDSFVIADNGCWEWQKGKNYHGYGLIRAFNKSYQAHRLSWMYFRGTIPTGKFVLHICDNPACVNPEHLYLGTQKQNMMDRDRQNHQSRKGAKRMKPEQVMAMRKEYREGVKATVLSEKYGVSIVTVFRTISGRGYKGIPMEA